MPEYAVVVDPYRDQRVAIAQVRDPREPRAHARADPVGRRGADMSHVEQHVAIGVGTFSMIGTSILASVTAAMGLVWLDQTVSCPV